MVDRAVMKMNRSSRNDNQHPRSQTLDRLSALPDTVLLQILSYLPMDEVIRTCILSKQWKTLWASTSTLMFRYRIQSNDQFYIRKFISFVDKTLVLFHCPKIKKFSIDFAFQNCFSGSVNVWVKFAAKHNVEELELNFSNEPGEGFILPQFVYDNENFTKLSLSSCIIRPKEEVYWKLLKVLRIEATGLSDDVIQKIISGSPVLESLELCDCWGIDRLDISNGNLRKLVINGYGPYGVWPRKYSTMEIWAPFVWSLEIVGFFNCKKIQLVNVRSCVVAKLDFYLKMLDDGHDDINNEHHDMLADMLVGLCNAKDLSLGTWCIEVLSMVEKGFKVLSMVEKGLPSLLSKWKCLKLHTPIQKRYLDAILVLLLCSPDVETLIINMARPYFEFETCFDADYFGDYNFEGDSYWTSRQGGLLRCLIPRLKTIKIFGFEGRHCGLEVPFLQFLKSYVQEKITINTA